MYSSRLGSTAQTSQLAPNEQRSHTPSLTHIPNTVPLMLKITHHVSHVPSRCPANPSHLLEQQVDGEDKRRHRPEPWVDGVQQTHIILQGWRCTEGGGEAGNGIPRRGGLGGSEAAEGEVLVE